MTDIATAVHAIALNIGDAVAARRTCCSTCGCLIFTWERCPACALNNANHNGATA